MNQTLCDPVLFYVIGCSETWFTAQTNANSFQIPGDSDNCMHSRGGGVALFVNQAIHFALEMI